MPLEPAFWDHMFMHAVQGRSRAALSSYRALQLSRPGAPSPTPWLSLTAPWRPLFSPVLCFSPTPKIHSAAERLEHLPVGMPRKAEARPSACGLCSTCTDTLNVRTPRREPFSESVSASCQVGQPTSGQSSFGWKKNLSRSPEQRGEQREQNSGLTGLEFQGE